MLTLVAESFSPGCTLCHGRSTGLSGLCVSCIESLPWVFSACPQCALPQPHSKVCGPCSQRSWPFQFASTSLRYTHPVSSLVLRLKYAHQCYLATTLAYAMVIGLERGIGPDIRRESVVTTIPTTPSRWRERGFNPAREIARLVSRTLGLRFDDGLLQCVGDGPAQSSLDTVIKRTGNVRQRFSAALRCPSDVVIIDDVMTTGATVSQAARLLRHSGTEMVQVWACARAVPGHAMYKTTGRTP
jgi:ComF family protein